MLETCRGGPRPIRLCVEKTKNFGQIQPGGHRGPGGQKLAGEDPNFGQIQPP